MYMVIRSCSATWISSTRPIMLAGPIERNVKLRSKGSVDWLGGGGAGGWPPRPCDQVTTARPKQVDSAKTVVVIRRCKPRASIKFLSLYADYQPNGLSKRSAPTS